MQMNSLRVKALGLSALAAVLLSGCATTGQLEEVRAMAAAAQDSAAKAEQSAASAQATADRAEASAQDANSCCAANSERIERAFQKALRK